MEAGDSAGTPILAGHGLVRTYRLGSGLVQALRGDDLLDGRPVSGLSDDALADARRDRIGFVFQSFNLVPVLTAEENVAYPMTLKGAPAPECRARARALLARVGLEDRAAVRPDLL